MDKKFNEFINDFLEENPILKEIAQSLPENEDGMLFSKEFRQKMSSFNDMNCEEALTNPDFLRTLCEHGGMSFEDIDNILKN